jgi:hypothetical protein
MCTYSVQIHRASYLTSLTLGIECLRVFSIPGGFNVQETRSSVVCHGSARGSYGSENGRNGTRQWRGSECSGCFAATTSAAIAKRYFAAALSATGPSVVE